MSELRYRWGTSAAQASPIPPDAETPSWGEVLAWLRRRWQVPGSLDPSDLVLLVGEIEVWQGEVGEIWPAWARRCALLVARDWQYPDLYPPSFEAWVQSGGREPADEVMVWLGHTTLPTELGRAIACALGTSVGPEAMRWARRAAQHARRFSDRGSPAHGGGDMATLQQDHLRTLILQHALPEALWGLIPDERVLCDALLEGRCR